VSASGYAADDRVTVNVIHPNGTTLSTDPSSPVVPQADPRALPGDPFAGIVEVNHPGGACWFQTTPDIRPGDVVEIDIVGGPNTGQKDATTVMNVTAGRPVQTAADTVVIHGTAIASDGVSSIPISQLEQRLVANRDAFDLNGRRTLRAPGVAGNDGRLTYDGSNSFNWTATYTGLDAADVARALGAESRILWLGLAVAPALEGTIYENGAGVLPGPAAPCSAPLEKLPPPPGSELIPPTTPTLNAPSVANSNSVTLTWSASTDNVGVTSYGIYRDGVAIFNVENADGSAPAPTTFVDKNVAPGTYTYTVDAADAIGNRSGQSNAVSATTTAQSAPTVTANEPPVAPVQIIGFPSRDFTSSSGYLANDTVDVQVIRNGKVVSTSSGLVPQADPKAAPGDPFAGTVEVNHPGGGCWEGVTPELRAGDIIRQTAYKPDGTVRTIDQTTVANVTAKRPVKIQDGPNGIVEIHGTAMGLDGKPLPVDQIEQRLVANRDAFDFNGRRTIRAGGAGKDGVLTYDTDNNPTGVNWTARYTGLSADDVARAVGGTSTATGKTFPGSESRILWLGSVPLAGFELTIFENSDATIPGPSAGACTAPLEAPDTTAPSAPTLSGNASGTTNFTLTWTSPTPADDWYVYGYRISRDNKPLANVGRNISIYTDSNVPPGSHTYTVAAFDSASPRGAGGNPIDQLFAGFGQPYGNYSVESNSASTSQNDVTPPSVPTNVVGVLNADSSVSLSWSPSTDNVAVASYGVYRDGALITAVSASVSPLGYKDTGVTPGTHTYTVDAADAAQPTPNRSQQSAPATVIVNGSTAVPTAPTITSAAASPDIHGRDVVVNWSSPTSNNGLVTGFGVYRKSGLPGAVFTKIADINGSTFSYTDLTLAPGTYTYTVDAANSAGNRSSQSSGATAVVANDPPVAPHSLIAFPARDFISATGYTPGATYIFALIRGGQTYVSAAFAADSTGLIEVNHPGGTCWNVNTPDMRPGDVIRITDGNGIADQTTVANVTAQRPLATNANTIVVHGTAVGLDGKPLPIEQVESRLVANRDLFDANGRRVLRAGTAGADGVLAYDSAGSINWTATYTNLSATDMVRAVGGTTTNGTVFVGAESRALWLGRDPLALTESTIFENGPGVVGGPSAPCTAPAETPVAAATFTPTTASFGSVPTGTSSATSVTFTNGGGSSMTITNIYIAGLNPGDFTIANNSCPVATGLLGPGNSCTVNVTFKPTATRLYQANLSFSDNAANTTDQTIPLTGTGSDSTLPAISLTPTSLSFGTVQGGQSPIQTITVNNSGAGTLAVGILSVTGAAAGDFTATANGCGSVTSANNGSCKISVQFKPGALGARTATLTINHNATASGATSTSVPLTGTGSGSVLSFNANPIQFGTVDIGRTKDQTITIKNAGNADATLSTNFPVTGQGYSVVSTLTTCTSSLTVNKTCNVVVRFAPPVGSAGRTFAGTFSATAGNGLPTTVTTNLTATAK